MGAKKKTHTQTIILKKNENFHKKLNIYARGYVLEAAGQPYQFRGEQHSAVFLYRLDPVGYTLDMTIEKKSNC